MMTLGGVVSCRNYGQSHNWLVLHTIIFQRKNVIIDRFYSLFFFFFFLFSSLMSGRGGLNHNWLNPLPLKKVIIDCFYSFFSSSFDG